MKNFLLLIAAGIVFTAGCNGAETTASTTSDTAGAASATSATPPAEGGTPKVAETTSTASGTPASKDYAPVQAVFTQNCVSCHGAGRARGGIHLTDHDAVLKGGEEGAIVVAGKPEESLLIKSLRKLPGAKPMPPRGPLSEDQIKVVEKWIKDGAKS
jgi:mono/diheme cytochrome c family protein